MQTVLIGTIFTMGLIGARKFQTVGTIIDVVSTTRNDVPQNYLITRMLYLQCLYFGGWYGKESIATDHSFIAINFVIVRNYTFTII